MAIQLFPLGAEEKNACGFVKPYHPILFLNFALSFSHSRVFFLRMFRDAAVLTAMTAQPNIQYSHGVAESVTRYAASPNGSCCSITVMAPDDGR